MKNFSTDKVLDIDFETRSKADITKVGAMKYCEDPSTEIMMISFSYNGREVYNWNPFTSKEKQPHIVLALAKLGYVIRAFNSEFEYWAWNLVATRQLGWPVLPVEQFYCVMAMSVAMAYPASLEKSGAAFKTESQKDGAGTRLINWFSKPKPDGTFRHPHDHPDKFNQFIDYCDDDVATQIDIVKKTKDLSPFEHKVFLLTEKMNVRGIPIDTDLVHAALDLVDQFQGYANKKSLKIAGKDAPFESLTQTARVKEWLNANGCDIPNMQKEVILEWLNDAKRKIPKKCRKILHLRSQAAKASTSKYLAIARSVDKNGRIHGFIKYHIARTGRWGGRGVQIQNFPKPGKSLPKNLDWNKVAELIKKRDMELIEKTYGDTMEVLAGALRAAICAPKGYKFVSADYSQVEARFVMWFADDPVGLDEFGGEGKVYEGMASQIYGVKKEDILKGSFERDIGKQTILGAGFGMGAPKFVASCKEKAAIDVSKELSEKAIYGYRKRYAMVPKLWKECEKAAINAVMRPGKIFRYIHVAYQMRGEHLYCILPSGREITYPLASIRTVKSRFGPQNKLYYWGVDSFSNKWKELDTWGGKLTENFVQAAARDCMAFGLINCEEKGYKSLFTVHDEGVSIVEEEYGSYQEYERLMCVLPKWAKGCPIEAEGWEGKRYRK